MLSLKNIWKVQNYMKRFKLKEAVIRGLNMLLIK